MTGKLSTASHAVRIGFVTVLRAGLIGAVAVTALFAIFAFNRNMVILLMPVFGIVMAASLTPIAALGVIQASKDEPGSLPGIANASFGIGRSLGFAWAGTICGAGYESGVPVRVVDLRRHRRRRRGDEHHPQAQTACHGTRLNPSAHTLIAPSG